MNRYRDFKQKITKEGKRYYNNILYPNVFETSDDVYIITREGDRLDLLAFDFYNDKSLWWVLIKANPNKVRRDSYYLKPGIRLRIPAYVSDSKEDFRELNKGR